MNIYDNNGWLALERIYLNPLFNFYVIVGPRQVGKTYGTARFILNTGDKFLWMRRTEDEILMLLSAPENSPFYAHDADVYIKQLPKTKLCGVFRTREEMEPELIGYCAALSTIKNLRGFNLTGVKWLIYDEFIPESHVRKFKHEGDAFLNAYTTISGNREIEGQPPLKAILLSNSNDLSHDILYSLGVIHDIEDMERKGKEIRLLDARGIAIILPRSEKVIGERKKSALARVLSNDSAFWEMAFNNEFAYNSDLYIMPVDPAALVPYCKIGKLYFYMKKGTECFYCSVRKRGIFNVEFPDGKEGVRASMFYSFPVLDAYEMGLLAFEEYTAKKLFIDTFNIKM